jgi:anti-sigma regulatory factor (Ser/Thr protein kinase)
MSVTQMHAMLRMALRLGAPLDVALMQLNNLLAETLGEDRFITAFIGLLDPDTHRLRYVNAGQGPVFQFHAAERGWTELALTGFPLGALPLAAPRPVGELQLAPGDLLVLVSDGLYEHANGAGEMFGPARVQALVAAKPAAPLDALADSLLVALNGFAQGAPQEDDITLVLLRREPVSTARFERRIQALPSIVAFTQGFFVQHGLDAALRQPVDFALEELFTNIVRHGSGSTAPVSITLQRVPGGVEVLIDEPEAERFDPTQAPDADTRLPVARREPGGLGLHLVRRFVDALDYTYDETSRSSRIRFRKTTPSPASGEPHAGH